MRKVWALFRVSFRGLLYALSFGGSKRHKKAAGGGVLALFALLCLVMGASYGMGLAMALQAGGGLWLLPAALSLMAVLLCGVFTVLGAKEIVFGTKDMDLCLALPVRPFQLILARLAALYAENLLLSAAFLAPAGIICIAMGAADGWLLARFVPAVALLGGLPAFFALAAGFALAWVSGRFARHTLVETLLYLAVLAAVLGGSFWAAGRGMSQPAAMADPAQLAGLLEGALSGFALPAVWFARFLVFGEPGAFLLLAGVGLLPVLALAAGCSPGYARLLASLQSRGSRSDYRLGAQKSGGVFWALLKKELARYFGTPIWLFNTIMGPVLLVAAGVWALVQGGRMMELLLENLPGLPPLLPLAAGIMAFLLTLTTVTASAVSLEGKSLWVLQTLPVSAGRVLAAKTALHLLVCWPGAALGGALLAAGLGLGVGGGAWLVALGLGFSWCCALLGLLLNLRFPKLDAASDTVVVKQSAAVGLSMLAGLVLAMACAGAWSLCGGLAGAWAGPLGALAVLLAAGAAMQRLLAKRGEAALRALSE